MTSLRTRTPRFGFALLALFAVVALIAVLAYTISAWQVFGFARHVWKLPLPLCYGAAVVADLLSLSGLFATYVLREAKLRVRFYAWTVFVGMTALSIAAAESFAHYRKVSGPAQFAAGAIVVALALAVHLLIVAVRHSSAAMTAEQEPTPPPSPATTTQLRPARKTVSTEAATPSSTPTAPPARPAKPPAGSNKASGRGRQVDPEQQRQHDRVALEVIAARTSVKDAATEQGVSTRTIQNWVASFRERKPVAASLADQAVPPAEPIFVQSDDQPAEIGFPQLTEEVNV